jgi:hypothetical protein
MVARRERAEGIKRIRGNLAIRVDPNFVKSVDVDKNSNKINRETVRNVRNRIIYEDPYGAWSVAGQNIPMAISG